jgi:hypothetical protein
MQETALPHALEEPTRGSSAAAKARRLLCEILPERPRKEFIETGAFHHEGNGVTYRISESGQTEIYANSRLSATACLQLSIPAPGCDRMLAEYLILKNDEAFYWKVANVFPTQTKFDFRVVTFLVLDVLLLVDLIWIVYRIGIN